MTFELDGESPLGVLSEVETFRWSPLNQCDKKSCCDGISVLTANTLFMYQVHYNKLLIIYYLNFVTICRLGFMCVCIYYSPHTVQVHFIFFIHCCLIFPFDSLLSHDTLRVYKIIS